MFNAFKDSWCVSQKNYWKDMSCTHKLRQALCRVPVDRRRLVTYVATSLEKQIDELRAEIRVLKGKNSKMLSRCHSRDDKY